MPIPNRPKCMGYTDDNEIHHPCDQLADYSYWAEYKGADESMHNCQPCHNVKWGI